MRKFINIILNEQYRTKSNDNIIITHKINEEETEHETEYYGEYYEIIDVTAEINGKIVAWGKYSSDENSFRGIEVKKEYRRMGIASAIYDYMKDKGYYVRPSDNLEPDGEAFWKNRNK